MVLFMNSIKKVFLVVFLLLLSGCSMTAKKDSNALFYENRELVKEYQKDKGEIVNPDIDTDLGYCPTCEL